MQNFPILYSFRRCPFAIRARMAIYQSNVKCEIREVDLNDKPESMLSISIKGTVPVLWIEDEKKIDESIEIMYWALNQHDPSNWLTKDDQLTNDLIIQNDNEFKYFLDRYKYHVSYPEYSKEEYRNHTHDFLETLEKCLNENEGVSLTTNQLSFSDVSIFPFIRQFANVDLDWFNSSPYDLLKIWYKEIEQSILFKNCMHKYKKWLPEESPIYFPSGNNR
jgi:glutathione S-transferase